MLVFYEDQFKIDFGYHYSKDYSSSREFLIHFGGGHWGSSVLEPLLPEPLDPGVVGPVHGVILLVRLVAVALGLQVLSVLVINRAQAERADASTDNEFAALKQNRIDILFK